MSGSSNDRMEVSIWVNAEIGVIIASVLGHQRTGVAKIDLREPNAHAKVHKPRFWSVGDNSV